MNSLAERFILCLGLILSPAAANAEDAFLLGEQDLDFLEFLGEGDPGDGEWIHPLDLLDQLRGNVQAPDSPRDLRSQPEKDSFTGQEGEWEREPNKPSR